MSKEKNQRPAAIDKLRKLINDGFKEYDGDIREEALEALDSIVLLYNAYNEANQLLQKQLTELLKTGDIIYKGCNEMGRIDFGTGTLYYAIKKESAITVKELMQAIRDNAMVVPLQQMTNAIKKLK